MRYFYDTEFIEDGHTIDLVSIGMVSEDGRAIYSQNQDCKFRRASDWVKANVYPHLRYFDQKKMRPLTGPYDAPGALFVWRTREQIAQAIRGFCDLHAHGKPEFWGYYSAYDHVAFCQLFGTMMDLPDGWPMYTNDIKQLCKSIGNPRLPEQGKAEHDALADARWNKSTWEWLNAREVQSQSTWAMAEPILRQLTDEENVRFNDMSICGHCGGTERLGHKADCPVLQGRALLSEEGQQ